MGHDGSAGADPALAVSLAQVSVRIGRRLILDRVDLAIARGSVVGVLGANGAGKSTLLGAVTGLRAVASGAVALRDDAGRIIVDGRASLGVVLQETALYDELSVRENLAFFAALHGMASPRSAIDRALAVIGLDERGDERVATLSGGLRRRAAIARALLHEPRILVIDEPTLGVDAEARQAIWMHLRRLRARGVTVLVATNYLDEALALCDRVAVLRQGRVAAIDAPTALVARAGARIDIECGEREAGLISASIVADPAAEPGSGLGRGDPAVRAHPAPMGLSLAVPPGADTDALMRRVLAVAPIGGFRVRGPDLAEIFRALDASAVDAPTSGAP